MCKPCMWTKTTSLPTKRKRSESRSRRNTCPCSTLVKLPVRPYQWRESTPLLRPITEEPSVGSWKYSMIKTITQIFLKRPSKVPCPSSFRLLNPLQNLPSLPPSHLYLLIFSNIFYDFYPNYTKLCYFLKLSICREIKYF